MEWVVLALVVPAVLIPVVLLWGFAGCDFNPGVLIFDPPSTVQAVGTSTSSIRVTWDGADPSATSFQLLRTKEGDTDPSIIPAPASPFDDTGLEEATTYFYQVQSLRAGDGAQSAASPMVAGRTIGLVFQNVFNSDQSALEGFCIVQRIEAARLRLGTVPGDSNTPGARVRITVRGSTVANLMFDNVSISQVAPSGDPYDSAPDMKNVVGKIVIPANTPIALPDVQYDLDHTRPLLVAFDIDPGGGSGNVRLALNVPAADGIMYFRAATAESGILDRSPSAANPGAAAFIPSPCIYLVDKIEVV